MTVGALLKGGADPNAVNRARLTPLLLEVNHGGDDGTIVTLLLNAGADPDRTAPNGDAPLHIAIRNDGWTGTDSTASGKAAMVKALLAGGADPDRKSSRGNTPLHLGAGKYHDADGAEVVSPLLQAGAAPCIKDREGYIPFSLTGKDSHIRTRALLDRAQGYDRACTVREEQQNALAHAKNAERGLTRAQRRQVQACLTTQGYDPGPADGAFDPRTREAIRGWQAKTARKPADGYLSRGQVDALLSACRVAARENQTAKREAEEEAAEPDAGASGGSGATSRPQPGVAGGVPSPLCSAAQRTACWVELQDPLGCYVFYAWNRGGVMPIHVTKSPFSWSGECIGGKPSGRGKSVFRGGQGQMSHEAGAGPYAGEGSLCGRQAAWALGHNRALSLWRRY